MLVREPEKERKLIAAVLMVLYILVAVGLLGTLDNAVQLAPAVWEVLGGVLPITGVGLIYMAWKWPELILGPWARLLQFLRQR